MAKKKNKNKKVATYKKFVSALKENQKKIFVMNGEEKVSLEDAVDASVANITSVPKDGVIPITSDEASKKRDESEIQADIRYAKTSFTLYEYAMKYYKTRQTLVLTMTQNDVLDLFVFNACETVNTLMERTNIALILKKMEKAKKKLEKWLEREPETDYEMFVLNIPDIVLFTNVLKKKEVSNSVMFNMTIQVVKTKKSISKMKKKDSEAFEEMCKSIKADTLKNAINLGNASIHIDVADAFMTDAAESASQWSSAILDDESNKKLFNRIIFSTDDSNNLVTFSNELQSKFYSHVVTSK